jgi:hypothetical protein
VCAGIVSRACVIDPQEDALYELRLKEINGIEERAHGERAGDAA